MNGKLSNTDSYWFCLIGPAKRKDLPHGADFPLRISVRRAFTKMTKHDDKVCSSGWGVSEERFKVLRAVSVIEEDDSDFKKIQAILKKRQVRLDKVK